jgi:hypothetical protein
VSLQTIDEYLDAETVCTSSVVWKVSKKWAPKSECPFVVAQQQYSFCHQTFCHSEPAFFAGEESAVGRNIKFVAQ